MNKNVSHVTIVLSTYNGEKFLAEQLDSLFDQTHNNFCVLVRDDGSKDLTKKILNKYSKEHKNFHVIFGKNIGVISSFLELLEVIPWDTDYIALCDQDDVWYPNKIERSIERIKKVSDNSPIMYCGALEIVDEKLNPVRILDNVKKEPAFKNALVQNVATGCTIVINSQAKQLLINKDVDLSMIRMHDWWIYQVISVFGNVIYDHKPMIKYRQHTTNVVGSLSGINLWRRRINRYIKNEDYSIRYQASELLRIYNEQLPKHKKYILTEFLEIVNTSNFFKRLIYAFQSSIYRQKTIDDLILRILLILKRI